MSSTRTRSTLVGGAAAVVMSLGLAAGAVAPATAAGEAGSCERQEAQVQKAEQSLERLTAVFERKQDRVEKARKEFRGSDTAKERREARRGLARSQEARDEAKKDKKAQQQRLAKAQERLDRCEAAQEA